MTTRQKLNLNIDSLFPGETISIGDAQIVIRPLNLLQISTITKKLKGFMEALTKDGIDFDNYSQPENILKIGTILLEQFPEVLEEASNIELEDLQQLPLEYIVLIINKVIEVNIKSKEDLVGNFKSLIALLPVEMKPEEKQKSPKQSKS